MVRPPSTIANSTIRQHPERSVPDEAPEILAKGLVAHVGFVLDGRPHVLPFTYDYDPASPDRIHVHGSLSGTTLTHLAGGAPVCVEVSHVDGLVYSKTALYHSMNYRSVVAYGSARKVEDPKVKRAMFDRLIARYFQGRTEGADFSPLTPEHIDSVAVLEIRIQEWSAKARRGGPRGPHDDDPAAPGTSGVIDMTGPGR
jgi:nitroimidazol reductase NimA-like FMN-containing flavoprotein (pyridoxamine 5'-phosphate oxidase superfamily)